MCEECIAKPGEEDSGLTVEELMLILKTEDYLRRHGIVLRPN